MPPAELIDLSAIYYDKLTRDQILDWRNLPKFKDGHPDLYYFTEREKDLLRFISKKPRQWSEAEKQSRRYQPETIELGQILFALADDELNIIKNHSKPLAILMGGGDRNTYIYETDNPNIFLNVRVLDENQRRERGLDIRRSTEIYLEKYTPEERGKIIADLNSPRTKEWRLDQ